MEFLTLLLRYWGWISWDILQFSGCCEVSRMVLDGWVWYVGGFFEWGVGCVVCDGGEMGVMVGEELEVKG